MVEVVSVAPVDFERKLEYCLARLEPKFMSLGYKYANRSADPADVASEIRLKVLTNLRKNQLAFSILSLDDLIKISIPVASNFAIDLVRKSIRRPDTSVYTKSVDDVLDDEFPRMRSWGNQESRVISKDLYLKLLESARKLRLGEDLARFIKELVRPGKNTVIHYLEWRAVNGRNNAHKNKGGIPAEVVGKALGFGPSKVSRFKEKIAALFVQLGVPHYEVYAKPYEIPDRWYVSQGLPPIERARQVGLEASKIRPNPIRAGLGDVKVATSSSVREVSEELKAQLQEKLNSAGKVWDKNKNRWSFTYE